MFKKYHFSNHLKNTKKKNVVKSSASIQNVLAHTSKYDLFMLVYVRLMQNFGDFCISSFSLFFWPFVVRARGQLLIKL